MRRYSNLLHEHIMLPNYILVKHDVGDNSVSSSIIHNNRFQEEGCDQDGKLTNAVDFNKS